MKNYLLAFVMLCITMSLSGAERSKINHFVKPNAQSQACLNYAMARNGRIYSNIFW